jgi:NADPH-dependent 2,4-dienoyl-CoA reductase/sulfur reductase-like enzyme
MVLHYEDVLDQQVEVGQSVTIFDNVSNELAIGLGLFLARSGKTVTIITPYSRLGGDQHTSHSFSEVHLHELLGLPDVSLRTNTNIQSIEDGKVILVNQYSNGQTVELETDNVILINHFENDQALRGALATTELEVSVIGDALGYGPMHDAILAGHRVGRSI